MHLHHDHDQPFRLSVTLLTGITSFVFSDRVVILISSLIVGLVGQVLATFLKPIVEEAGRRVKMWVFPTHRPSTPPPPPSSTPGVSP